MANDVLARGLLVHESGFVLKPVQAPPKGTREVAFYQVGTFRTLLNIRRFGDYLSNNHPQCQSINSSEDEFDQRLVQLTARFYGTQAVKVTLSCLPTKNTSTSPHQVQNGVVGLSDYLVLENLTQGLGAPCVMDVKIGARTYGPDASEAKKKQEDAKYQGTKVLFIQNQIVASVRFVLSGPLWLQRAWHHQPQQGGGEEV